MQVDTFNILGIEVFAAKRRQLPFLAVQFLLKKKGKKKHSKEVFLDITASNTFISNACVEKYF